MSPVRWGILSTSSFAEEKFLPGLRKSSEIEVVAVASRSAESADAFAARNNIPRAYHSYEAMLADPSIDVIYNPLPNHLHVPWTAKAAAAGKNVLCEKPFALTAAELESLRPHTSHVHIAEAFMVRHHPQWIQTREIVRSGSLGRITHAHVEFAYNNTDALNIRNIASAGGGAMYDIGCYAVVAIRWFLEREPLRVAALADRDPQFHTDRMFSGLVDMGSGLVASLNVSTQSVYHQRVNIYGTEGRLEVTIPFNQPQDAPTIYLTHDGSSDAGLDAVRHEVPTADQYTLLAEAFGRQVRNEAPSSIGLDDAIRNAKVMDALFRAEKSGSFEAV
jgi:predicted dehydrogenase